MRVFVRYAVTTVYHRIAIVHTCLYVGVLRCALPKSTRLRFVAAAAARSSFVWPSSSPFSSGWLWASLECVCVRRGFWRAADPCVGRCPCRGVRFYS